MNCKNLICETGKNSVCPRRLNGWLLLISGIALFVCKPDTPTELLITLITAGTALIGSTTFDKKTENE